MSPPRFYLPQFARLDTASLCQLTGPEAKHATAVLRLREGDQVELFNGLGQAVRATIVSRRKDVVDCQCIAGSWCQTGSGLDLTLIIALPKGDRQRVLVDAVTELGVTRLVPLLTRRGVAQPTDSALERLQRTMIEACKQSGRNRLMEIVQPREVGQLAAQTVGSKELRLVAHPYLGPYPLGPLVGCLQGDVQSTSIVIGPEGGLTDQEIQQLAQSGWQVVTLSSTILRIEVAAIAAVAQILGWYHGRVRTTDTPATQAKDA